MVSSEPCELQPKTIRGGRFMKPWSETLVPASCRIAVPALDGESDLHAIRHTPADAGVGNESNSSKGMSNGQNRPK